MVELTYVPIPQETALGNAYSDYLLGATIQGYDIQIDNFLSAAAGLVRQVVQQ